MTRTKYLQMCTQRIVVICFLASVLTSIQGHVVEFVVEPVDTVVQSGNGAVLDCVVKSTNFSVDTINMQWLDKDGQAITFIGDNYRSQLTNNSLYISSVVSNESLTGSYQCKASLPNGAGSIVSRTAQLTIASVSNFEQEPEDVSVYAGQKAHFPCRIRSSPPAKIRWLKDERPLQLDELRMTILPSGALEIDEIREADQGSYRCNASGLSTSKLSKKATLSIVDDDNDDVSPPKFIGQPLSSVVVVEGQTVTLDCAANGNPRPNVKWLKNGHSIDMADLDSRFSKVGTTSSLKISHIKEEDDGTYQCRAENGEDSLDASSTVEVQVPPRFLKKPTDKVEYAKNDVELECSVYGRPDPQVQWLKNGEMIHSSEYHKLVNGTNLKINGLLPTDTGLFQCIASNPAGNVQASASLKVIDLEATYPNPEYPPKKYHRRKKPQGPKTPNHQLDESRSQAIFNSLKLDGSSGNLGSVDYGHLVSTSRQQQPPLASSSQQVDSHKIFSSLSSSENGGGGRDSLLGDALNAYTDPNPPRKPFTGDDERQGSGGGSLPGPPLDVAAVMTSARFIVLKWKAPLETEDDIVAYSVFYRQDGSNRERVQNTTRARLEEIHIANLQPSTVYHFRVVAHSLRSGTGVSSEIVSVTTGFEENLPSAPRNFQAYATGARTVHVAWDPPEYPNGAILRYNINYMETSTSEELKLITADTETELNSLSVFSEYSIWVEAINTNGLGASTLEILVKTFSDVPSEPPYNVTVEPSSSTSIMVRWEPPPVYGQNGVITGYKLRYRKKAHKGDTITTAANARMYSLPNLDRAASYQVKLWALNVNGTGPATDWVDVNTYENDLDETRVPDAPSPLKVRATATSIIIVWSPPHDQNTKIRGYILGWGKGIPDMYTQILTDRDRSHVIEPLEANSEYVISLRASNDMGAGPPVYGNIRTRDEPPPEPVTPLIPPVGLKSQVLSATSVVLYWTDTTISKSQSGRDRFYVVQYGPEESSKKKTVNVTNNNLMISDLRPGTLYEFMVRLVKGKRASPWSMVVTNSTWDIDLNTAPRELEVHSLQEDSQMVELTWQHPKQQNGHITGYVIMYTTDMSKRDRDWLVSAVKGDKLTFEMTNLLPSTKYYFKIQARNSKGYGPFSPIVSFKTGQNMGIPNSDMRLQKEGVFSGPLLLYLIGGALSLVVLTIVPVAVWLCCRCRGDDPTSTTSGLIGASHGINTRLGGSATSPDRSKKGYQKGNQHIKPPDLWIHHDQMELKNLEKGGTGGNDGASSSGALTLPRGGGGGNEYDERDHMNSLEKRGYTPNYMDDTIKRTHKHKPIMLPVDSKPPREPIVTTTTPLSSSTLSSDSTPIRPSYPRTQYTIPRAAHVTLDQNGLQTTIPGGGNIPGGGVECPYATHTQHSSYDPNAVMNNSNYMNQIPPIAHVAPSNSAYAPGLSVLADSQAIAAAKRLPPQAQGHPLKSFTVPAPPPISAPGTPQPPKHVVRPNVSPYKKIPTNVAINSSSGGGSNTTLTGTPPSRISAANPPPHTHEEVQRLQPSHSTEELNQEMANLEGLMITLNAITANEFEC